MRSLRHAYTMLKSAGVLKPELVVTVLSFLLPDILDKPLWMIGIGHGRFVGHTLLLVFLVALVFFLRKRRYGLFALMGGMLHLLSDFSSFVPWFYPFKEYNFPQWELWRDFKWYWVGRLFVELSLVILAVSLLMWFLSLRKKLGSQSARDGEAAERADKR